MQTIALPQKIIFLLIIVSTFFLSCKKSDPSTGGSGTFTEVLFETNVLNRNFIVNLATDNGTDLTANYNGYTFVLQKTDYYHGPLQVTKGANTYAGSWSCNGDYSQLIITLPNSPSEFIFLTRAWRFTKKDVPQLELAPWGTSDPVVLHMYRQ